MKIKTVLLSFVSLLLCCFLSHLEAGCLQHYQAKSDLESTSIATTLGLGLNIRSSQQIPKDFSSESLNRAGLNPEYLSSSMLLLFENHSNIMPRLLFDAFDLFQHMSFLCDDSHPFHSTLKEKEKKEVIVVKTPADFTFVIGSLLNKKSPIHKIIKKFIQYESKEKIKQKIDEEDRLNKTVVRQLSGLPADLSSPVDKRCLERSYSFTTGLQNVDSPIGKAATDFTKREAQKIIEYVESRKFKWQHRTQLPIRKWLTISYFPPKQVEIEYDENREIYVHLPELLGKGGYKSVYKVVNYKTGEMLVKSVMELDPLDKKYQHHKDMIYREKQFYDQLVDSKRIPKLYKFKRTKSEDGLRDIFELYMPLYQGDLFHLIVNREEIRRRGFDLNQKVKTEIALQLLKSLKDLHDHEIYHRDIKPENILVGIDQGKIYADLMDFGLSDFYKEESNRKLMKGTANYISPRMAHAKVSKEKDFIFSASDDLWALGVVLYSLQFEHGITWFGLPHTINRYHFLDSLFTGKTQLFTQPQREPKRALETVMRGLLTADVTKQLSLDDGIRLLEAELKN